MSPSWLSDIADIVMGQSPPGDTCNQSGFGMPLLNGPTEFGSHHPSPLQFTTDPRKRALQGDLLFCVRGSTTGRMNWADQDYAIGRGVAAIRHGKSLRLQPLVRGLIETQLPTLLQSATGSTFPNVSAKQLGDLQVPNLSDDQQFQAADLLAALDDKIDLNRRMNETLEAMARAIFKDWFVDFGPTRAKAEGRAPYLAPELWDLFPDALDDEDKPVGWEWGTLADVVESPRRGVSPADVWENTPYIGLEHMPRRSIALSEWEGAEKVKSNKTRFNKGEILFGKLRPYFHKVGIAPLDGICSTDIVVVVPRAQAWGAFALACLSSDEFVDYTDRTSTGTKMPRTSWTTMAQYEMCLPPEDAVCAYRGIARPLLDRLCANIHETSTLAQTRDLLLPKLISGEICVAGTENIVERVL